MSQTPPTTTLIPADVWALIEQVYPPEMVAQIRAWERQWRAVLRRRAAQRARLSTQRQRQQQRQRRQHHEPLRA